jgi:hypothetical protein
MKKLNSSEIHLVIGGEICNCNGNFPNPILHQNVDLATKSECEQYCCLFGMGATYEFGNNEPETCKLKSPYFISHENYLKFIKMNSE